MLKNEKAIKRFFTKRKITKDNIYSCTKLLYEYHNFKSQTILIYVTFLTTGLTLTDIQAQLHRSYKKLYFRNMRVDGNTNQLIKANEEYSQIICRSRKHSMDVAKTTRYWKSL